jgi:hypothetical protein
MVKKFGHFLEEKTFHTVSKKLIDDNIASKMPVAENTM